MDTDKIHIALIGHCGPDSFALQSSVMGFVPGAVIHKINSQSDYESIKDQLSLLLVNRVLEAGFHTGSGIEFIGALGDGDPRAMLISNFDESIAESVEVGAVAGFGKSAMRSERAEAALKSALSL
jgi:Fe2+ transport system protein FeoA